MPAYIPGEDQKYFVAERLQEKPLSLSKTSTLDEMFTKLWTNISTTGKHM